VVVGIFNEEQSSPHNMNSVQQPGDILFMVGNGVSNTARSNALTVQMNGQTTVNGKAIINGSLVVAGTTDATGTVVAASNQVVLIPQQGDLAMGEFTAGAKPQ
jgi:hypothetical protein